MMIGLRCAAFFYETCDDREVAVLRAVQQMWKQFSLVVMMMKPEEVLDDTNSCLCLSRNICS